MSEKVLPGQWQQMSGEFKSWWGKLAEDDLGRISGEKDKLVGLVQEAYGYTRVFAEQEVERRFKEFADKSSGIIATMTAKAQEFGPTAATKANEAATVLGEKLGLMATMIRENTPRDGAVANAAYAFVDGLESVSSYLKEKKFDHLGKDITALVRGYPIQSVLIGIGLGYLLARRTR